MPSWIFFKAVHPKNWAEINSQKRHYLKKLIFKYIYFLPNFVWINMRAWKFKKMGSSFHKFSKLRWISKWLKNWFFDHISVSFKHLSVLFFDLSLYISRAYFTEEKFFSDPRWRLMSKMPTEIQSSITWAFSNIFFTFFLSKAFVFC
jgi:hypothetical protein